MKKIETVCLVDDDQVFKFLAQKAIDSTQLVNRLVTFSNGLEALEYIRSVYDKPDELPEIILLDLSMPVMDGWEFLEEYLGLAPRLNKKILVYILSSSINPTDHIRAKSISEVTDFILKPITKDLFMQIVRNI